MKNQPDQSSQNHPFQASSRICPFLGLAGDRQTFIAEPDERNFCHLSKPIQSILPTHQSSFCMSPNYSNCNIFSKAGKVEKKPIGEHERPQEGENEAKTHKERTVPSRREPRKIEPPSEDMNIDQKPKKGGSSNSLLDRLNAEANSRVEQVPANRKDRRNLWTILFFTALLVLVTSLGGIYLRYQRLQMKAQLDQERGYANQLATSVSQLELMVENINTVSATSQPQEKTNSEASTPLGAILMETDSAPQPIPTATLTQTVAVSANCIAIAETSFEVVSGPVFSPPVGTYYIKSRAPNAIVSWVIKNNKQCNWVKISLYKLGDQSITIPYRIIDGDLIALSTEAEPFELKPGEQIEIAITYLPTDAQFVNDEYALVVNDLLLSNDQYLKVDISGWLISVTRTPTPKATARPPETLTPGPKPTETPPTNR